MTPTLSLQRTDDAAVSRAGRLPVTDDKAMLRAAADMTRDLNVPSQRLYWLDLIASAALGYGALATAIFADSTVVMIVAGVISMFALYRAISFIHEVSHIKHSALPGFRTGWNALIGVPMLTPSFMYEGVHNQHHARTRYGTADDPEYLPLALMKPWSLPMFILLSALAPLGLLLRFAVLAPLSAVIPGFRRVVIARFSSLSINPQFRRRPPESDFARHWTRVEIATSIWAMTLVGLVVSGVLPLRAFAIMLAMFMGLAVINQVRTLVAHLWENDGEAMSVTAQYLDTVNVPPPSMLPMLWAPVGLRYHALHHLVPSVPYHNLGEAHRRISGMLEADSPYHRASHAGLPGLVWRIARSTMGSRRL